jgi:sugar phosphate isomerase/epimerase
MPKIGFASIAMHKAPWIDALETAVEHRFDAFELCFLYPYSAPEDITEAVIEKVRHITATSGIEFCVHAPFFELNIGACCGPIRAASIECIRNGADMAHKLGANVMVVHNGGYEPFGPPGTTRFNDDRYKYHWDRNIESIKAINEYAQDRGITVCLENIAFDQYSIDKSFADLREIQEKVGPSLQFTFDMGHARLSEGAQAGIDSLGGNIRHIHLTDNLGQKDDHLPLGDGNYDYSEFADFLKKFPHVITLEVVHMGITPEHILRGRQALYDLLKKCD